VRLYVRFPLSLRNAEKLLYKCGIEIIHGTVREWWNRFGTMFAADFQRKRVDRMVCVNNVLAPRRSVFESLRRDALPLTYRQPPGGGAENRDHQNAGS
jgi:hypothetical protein